MSLDIEEPPISLENIGRLKVEFQAQAGRPGSGKAGADSAPSKNRLGTENCVCVVLTTRCAAAIRGKQLKAGWDHAYLLRLLGIWMGLPGRTSLPRMPEKNRRLAGHNGRPPCQKT